MFFEKNYDIEEECVDEFPEICNEIPTNALESTCDDADSAIMCLKTCQQCIPGNNQINIFRILLYRYFLMVERSKLNN